MVSQRVGQGDPVRNVISGLLFERRGGAAGIQRGGQVAARGGGAGRPARIQSRHAYETGQGVPQNYAEA